MRFGQDDNKFFFKEQLAIQIDLIERRAQKPNVNFAFTQRLVLKAGKYVSALDFDRGQALAMVEYYLADQSTQSGSDTDPDYPRFSLLRMPSRFHRVSGLYHKLSRLIKKDRAGLSQRDAPLVTQKESDAQILFQLADLPTQRRLRDVQLLRSLAEIQVLRNGDKVANVT